MGKATWNCSYHHLPSASLLLPTHIITPHTSYYHPLLIHPSIHTTASGGNNVSRSLAPLSALTGLVSLGLSSSPDCEDITALSTLTGLRCEGLSFEWND